MHFTILLQIQYENNFLPTSGHRQTKFVAFLVFVCTNALLIVQISSSENVSKRDAINGSCRKTVTGANRNTRKLLFTDLVNTNVNYLTQERLVNPRSLPSGP